MQRELKLGANKSRHRMSSNNTDLQFEHRDVPLIVALHRWADELESFQQFVKRLKRK